MNFNRVLAAVVVLVFAGVCVSVILGRRGDDGKKDSGTTATSAALSGAPSPSVAPASSGLTLLFSSSLAKQTFIDRAVEDFNKLRIEVGGKVVSVKAQHVTSGDSWNEIKEGRSKPDLWSPGDESWIRIANETWRGLENKPLFESFEPIVNVPLCIAMWEPMAQALGYPKPLGWADLGKIGTDPEGWSRYQHPEWGAFKWGHAHPDANSGFLTVLAEVYAHAQKTKGLTVDDLKAPSLLPHLTRLEHSVEHYGLSNVWIENFMREKGPAYLSATVQYENAIIEGNRKSQNKPFKIVAIYPKEGTIFTQHPVGIPDASWMTAERKAAARKFLDFLLSPEIQALAMQLGVRPIKKMPMAAPFTEEWGVRAELPPIAGFEVPSEDVLKRIKDLWLAAKKPASIMMLLDISGSMQGEPMDKAKEGAVSFIEKMQPRDELEIRTFNDKVMELLPVTTVAGGGEVARQKVNGLFANGGTHLYDVIRAGVMAWNERKKKFGDRHYGIVLMTDGQDEGSTVTQADMMDVLPKGDNPESIKIFTIAYGPKAQKTLLKEIANKSNARAFEGSTQDIGRIYQELSAAF